MTPFAATLIVNSLDLAWPKLDPLSRSFRDALRDARARASAANWQANDDVSTADLRALSVGTQIWISVLESRSSDPYAKRWAAALSATMDILAKHGGYDGASTDELKTRAKKQNTTGALQFVEILIIVAVVGLIIAGVIAFIVWQARQTVDNQLARQSLDAELVRIHADAEKIIAQHLEAEKAAGHEIPWSDAELGYLKALEKAQAQIVTELGKTLDSPWLHPWPWLVLGGVATTVVLAVVFKSEIQKSLGLVAKKSAGERRRLAAGERRAR